MVYLKKRQLTLFGTLLLKAAAKSEDKGGEKETKNELSNVNNLLFLHPCPCCLPTSVAQLYSYYLTIRTSFHGALSV